MIQGVINERFSALNMHTPALCHHSECNLRSYSSTCAAAPKKLKASRKFRRLHLDENCRAKIILQLRLGGYLTHLVDVCADTVVHPTNAVAFSITRKELPLLRTKREGGHLGTMIEEQLEDEKLAGRNHLLAHA